MKITSNLNRFVGANYIDIKGTESKWECSLFSELSLDYSVISTGANGARH